MAALTNMNPNAIAFNRFGLGARPDDVMPSDPKKWLLAQFSQFQASPAAWADLPKTSEVIAEFAQYKQLKSMADNNNNGAEKRVFRRGVRDDYAMAVKVRTETAINTSTPFVEHLVH